MSKPFVGTKVGICSICGINLWSEKNGKPSVFPCNVPKCPYEDADKQNPIVFEQSLTGSGIAQVRMEAIG